MKIASVFQAIPRLFEAHRSPASRQAAFGGAGHTPELIAEAAMCIWEDMLSRHHHRSCQDVGDASTAMTSLWHAHGTVEMRHYAFRLALSTLDVFDMLGSDWIEENNLFPYDWEFIPMVVHNADWSSLYGADNSPGRIARAIRQTCGKTQGRR